ncbi:MAG: bacteriohemerythrin [Gammaproteobacteria bacterium]
MSQDSSLDQLNDAILRTRAEHRTAMAALRNTQRAYGHFVPKSFLNFLGTTDISAIQLGDFVEMKTSIMFADIQNFTALAEELKSADVFATLNTYLAQYEAPIHGHSGVIDKFLGDGALAIFRTADDAVAAGNEMLERVARVNQDRARQGLPTLEIGIGINTGYSALGVIGNAERLETTVIGDSVNVAARIQDLTRRFGNRMLISETTYLNLDDTASYAIRFADRIEVKGRTRPVSVYEVFDTEREQTRTPKIIGLDLFEDAVACYHLGYYQKGLDILARYSSIADADPLARVYMERCRVRRGAEASSLPQQIDQEFLWNPSYDTGHQAIDDQHHHLVEIYAALRGAVRSGSRMDTERVLVDLKDYSLTHFAVEKTLMEETDYPLINEHLHEHEQFVKRLNQLSSAIRVSERATETVVFWINIFLFDWLATHSSKIDRHLARYVARSASAGG